jgi:glycosyltransferase involved in cell wall biosynthesis
VRFAGHVAEPRTLYPGASLFVLSSQHEGMPNALLEAAAAGLPIVATPASPGLVELLRAQPGVWMATEASAPALAAVLLHALASLAPEQRFAHAFIEPFRADRVIAAFSVLIDATIAPNHPGPPV